MIHCTRCGRRLKRATPTGMGAVCERIVLGSKQRRERGPRPRDDRQADFFAADLAHARKVDTLLAGISLEMPRISRS